VRIAQLIGDLVIAGISGHDLGGQDMPKVAYCGIDRVLVRTGDSDNRPTPNREEGGNSTRSPSCIPSGSSASMRRFDRSAVVITRRITSFARRRSLD
jgi:hypothetical protein